MAQSRAQCEIPQSGLLKIIATPILRELRGEQFIHLNIKDILPAEIMTTKNRKGLRHSFPATFNSHYQVPFLVINIAS